MMKLILLSISMLTANLNVHCQRFQGDNFPFPPQFSTPGSGQYQPSSSMYLPPQSQTPLPFFSMKNMNNLKFPLLPPIGTRAPSTFPMIMSSTFLPNFDDDDDTDNREQNIKLRISSPKPLPSPAPPKFNNTERIQNLQKAERRELRMLPKMVDYQNPIDRIDVKFPVQIPNNNGPVSTSATPTSTNESRKINIIPQETHRNDRTIDQVKTSSFPGAQFLHAPVPFIPTTEPAIPIIRLSNEMDLDGSFSYE